MILDRPQTQSTVLNVLILAPTGQDAHLLMDVLVGESISCEIYPGMPELCSRMSKDCGALLIAEEALDPDSVVQLRERLNSQEPWSDIPIVVMTTGGKTTLAITRITRELSPAGNVTLLERPFRPITVTSSIRVALRARKRQMEVRGILQKRLEATQMRDEFISIASHELKTPLTSLKLQSQLNERMIKSGNYDISKERLQKLLETTNRQVDRLTRLVEDMLDVSRINLGKLLLRKTDVDLSALLIEIVDRLGPQVEAAGCTVELRAEKEIRGMWDQYRIEQVIINLLTNAIRYAPGSKIEIMLRQLETQVRLTIADNGPGIAPEDREKIFGRFERVSNSSGIEGLGLGLYICRQIVDSHGGRISVSDHANGGASFSVYLPQTTEVGDLAEIK